MTVSLPFNLTLAANEGDFKAAVDQIVDNAIIAPESEGSAPLEIIVGAYVITRWIKESEDSDGSGNFSLDDISLKNEACEGHCYVWKISNIDVAGLIDIIPDARESVICIEVTDANSPEEINRIIRDCAERTYLRNLSQQQILQDVATEGNIVTNSGTNDLRI